MTSSVMKYSIMTSGPTKTTLYSLSSRTSFWFHGLTGGCSKENKIQLMPFHAFHKTLVLLQSIFLSLPTLRHSDDWILSWPGSGTIFGWGHNHRGQLGGPEGAKVKIPVPCSSLAALKPMHLVGGEQTLFAVTPDGKVGRFLDTVGISFRNSLLLCTISVHLWVCNTFLLRTGLCMWLWGWWKIGNRKEWLSICSYSVRINPTYTNNQGQVLVIFCTVLWFCYMNTKLCCRGVSHDGMPAVLQSIVS